MSNEVTVIDINGIDDCEMTAEGQKAFADKVVYVLEVDYDTREISVTIPKHSPQVSPGLFSAEQIEKAILKDISRHIRELL